MAPKRIKKEVKRHVAAFEKDEPLLLDDVTCKICFTVFLDPVTFPCSHSLCKACFDMHIVETSLKCPFCNLRISIWHRQALKKKNVVNLAFKERIEREFPEEVKSLMADEEQSEVGQDNQYIIRVKDINSLLERNDEEDDLKVWDGQFCEPGAIAKDLEIVYQQHRLDLEKEQEDELNASQILIEQIIKEEEREIEPIVTQIQTDFELAQRLQQNSPPKLRSNSPPTGPPNRAVQFNLIAHQVIKNETPIGLKHRQSYPAALPLKRKKKSNSFAQKLLSKKSRAKQRKIGDFFSASPQSSSNSSLQSLSPATDTRFDGIITATTNYLTEERETLSSTFGCSEEPSTSSGASPWHASGIFSQSDSDSQSDIETKAKNAGEADLNSSFEDFQSSLVTSNLTNNSLPSSNFLGSSPDFKPEVFRNPALDGFVIDRNGNNFEVKCEDTKLLPSESEAGESSVPPDVLIILRQEEERIQAEKRRQELEDLKFALELQKAYDANSSIRGNKGRISEKYSIRNWMRSPQT